MEYRYMIWNNLQKEFQFRNICETTEKGALTCLRNAIGWDSNKSRFKVKKVTKDEAIKIKKKLKDRSTMQKLRGFLYNLTEEELYQLIDLNERRGNNG